MALLRQDFARNSKAPRAGAEAIVTRAGAVDELVRTLFAHASEGNAVPGVALVPIGGYGRSELFPYSDVDLMFLLEGKAQEKSAKELIRRVNQSLWDCGLRVSPMTRTLADCERFNPENVEFTLALLDARPLAGDFALTTRLLEKALPRLVERDRKRIMTRCLEVTRTRHQRYGNTLFHLEPNVKECPGGLRDLHVCAWVNRLSREEIETPEPAESTSPAGMEFGEAGAFLQSVRFFLHLRHGRDDNTLEWESQDEAAAAALGASGEKLAPAYWMRLYFRHARAIERRTAQQMAVGARVGSASRLSVFRLPRKVSEETLERGYEQKDHVIALCDRRSGSLDQANEPATVLSLFAAMAATGSRLSPETETRLSEALPGLAANLEDGAALWGRLKPILQGSYAGRALRAMHAVGLLELLFPQFHGIDALVIRDAYHRYTVDEHTFVVIDTLHALRSKAASPGESGLEAWAGRFAGILRDLPHPELLFLAALLHDTGKSRVGTGHAAESARMAETALYGLELDSQERTLVLDLIRNHLEMSAALRRDVFDRETVRSFATRVPTREALRMLTLFTFADITAVHPDALTPWKAENLWRLYTATSDSLDRTVDDQRVPVRGQAGAAEVLQRIYAGLTAALPPGSESEVEQFLEGWPRRYLDTRGPDQVRADFLLARALTPEQPNQIAFHYGESLSELTLITRDRPRLFAQMAGVLAAWAMNIVTAEAFSNAHGLVVDSFRFTDTFRTLEMNESERERFLTSVREVLCGLRGLEEALLSRRRGRAREPKVQVQSRVDFDDTASTQSTLLQVVAQDTTGLLHALALAIAEQQCSIEVALVDTEGEMAIDVFYLTEGGARVEAARKESLRLALLEAIERNAS